MADNPNPRTLAVLKFGPRATDAMLAVPSSHRYHLVAFLTRFGAVEFLLVDHAQEDPQVPGLGAIIRQDDWLLGLLDGYRHEVADGSLLAFLGQAAQMAAQIQVWDAMEALAHQGNLLSEEMKGKPTAGI